MKNVICILAVLVSLSLVAGCGGSNLTATLPPTSTPKLAATLAPMDTPKPTNTPTSVPTPTSTPTATLTPTKTPMPTRTPTPTPRALSPVRPVDSSVPLYHAYGVPVGGDPAQNGHNGYDYGYQACKEINYPVVAIEDGVIMQLGGEGDVWIDHGVVQLSDETIWRVMSTYWHIKYNNDLRVDMPVARGDPIAHFLSCAESGYFPELEIQMIRADSFKTRGLTGKRLLGFLVDNNYQNGEFTHFDPALVGLPPQ